MLNVFLCVFFTVLAAMLLLGAASLAIAVKLKDKRRLERLLELDIALLEASGRAVIAVLSCFQRKPYLPEIGNSERQRQRTIITATLVVTPAPSGALQPEHPPLNALNRTPANLLSDQRRHRRRTSKPRTVRHKQASHSV
jgi:hypothetical protein